MGVDAPLGVAETSKTLSLAELHLGTPWCSLDVDRHMGAWGIELLNTIIKQLKKGGCCEFHPIV